MRIAAMIFGLSLGLPGSSAAAETWREVTKVGEVPGYIDTDSIEREGDKVRFRLEVRYAQTQGAPSGQRFDRIASRIEIDCLGKTYRVLRIGAKLGDLSVFGGKSPDRSVQPVRPGTAADAEMRAVCSGDWAIGG